MLNTQRLRILGVDTLLQLNPETVTCKHDEFFIFTKKPLLYLTNSYFADISFFKSIKNSHTRITYNLFSLLNYKTTRITLINIKSIKSQSSLINVLDWYERELAENSTIRIAGLKDIRNLILPYSYKLNKNFTYRKQRQHPIITNLLTKQVRTVSKSRIVL